MPETIADRLREGVRRVGEAEPLIAIGKGMGSLVDQGLELYDKAKDYLRPTPRVTKRTGDINLPVSGKRKMKGRSRSLSKGR